MLVLLDRIETLDLDTVADEIAEMRVRIKPPTGAAAPIVLTGYTGPKAEKLARAAKKPARRWEMGAEVLIRRPVDGGDLRFGEALDSVRYRKD